MSRYIGHIAASYLLTSFLVATAFAADAVTIRFTKTQLDAKFRSEGVAVGDFNKDGKMDIAAGFVWYEAPAWDLHTIVKESPSTGRNGRWLDRFNRRRFPGNTDLVVRESKRNGPGLEEAPLHSRDEQREPRFPGS
ncbi:MAG: FG-GAP repeat protein [Planctomycetia bacterium]|nr:FG-GAP repeat protein [Planctomycetia bacterium]